MFIHIDLVQVHAVKMLNNNNLIYKYTTFYSFIVILMFHKLFNLEFLPIFLYCKQYCNEYLYISLCIWASVLKVKYLEVELIGHRLCVFSLSMALINHPPKCSNLHILLHQEYLKGTFYLKSMLLFFDTF